MPAVPVPFRGTVLAEDALRRYARWMAEQPVMGVAVWAHTGRGLHLTAEQRDLVLKVWRDALPNRLVIAGANSVEMARAAKRGGADALLAFPRALDPIPRFERWLSEHGELDEDGRLAVWEQVGAEVEASVRRSSEARV